MKRYIITLEGPRIVSVAQYGLATEDTLYENQKIIYTDEPPEKLLDSVYVNNTLVYLGQRPEFSEIDPVSLQWKYLIDRHKNAIRQNIKETRDAIEFGGFTWNGYPFDSDQISQQRLSQACQQALQAKLTNQEFSRNWTLSSGEILENITADQMLDICRTLADYVNSLHTRSQELYRQIDLAETKEQLEQIVW